MNVQAFLATLPVVLWGMIGIFAVMLVIYGVIAILNRVTPKEEK